MTGHLSCLRSLNGDGHLILLTGSERYIGHSLELHIPRIGVLLRALHNETVGGVGADRETKLGLIRCPADTRILGEVLAGYSGISLLGCGVGFVANQLEQPGFGLLRVPCERVTINVESSFGSRFYVFLNGLEVHISVTVYATGHFHSVARNRLGEVLVDHALERSVAEIVGNGCSGTEFEIGILRSIDVIFKSFVIIEVTIVIIVGLTQLKFFLGICRNKKTGSKHE